MTADNSPPHDVAAEITAYYATGIEESRLAQGREQLEEVRTKELLGRYLPPPPAVVLDVAGGPGAYALWLASQGYTVHLRDATPLHVEQARAASARQLEAPLRSAEVGDARAVALPDASVEAVLLLGPLYHLPERADRLQALREARRVLRVGGMAIVVGISRFASLQEGLYHGFLDDPAFQAIVDRDLHDGQHRNPTGRPEYFTTAFFHHPDELPLEVTEAGLVVEAHLAIEGPHAFIPDFPAWWNDAARRERLLSLLRRVEAERTLLGASPHFAVVARRSA
jgi:ubiquinone/menaquinone biosynthesis C-methylase UbiE